MPSLLDIRRRIRSVKNTQQLTKAMKTVSAARLRRAQERVVNARPYANQLRNVLTNLAAKIENISHPLLDARPEQRTLLVVVTADRGLCGAFNSNLIRVAQNFLRDRTDRNITLYLIGRKGRDFFRRRQAAITGDFVLTADEVNPVLRALRDNGIEVTALHNHMLDDEPRLFFMHFWANDDAQKLAKGLRAALDKVSLANK